LNARFSHSRLVFAILSTLGLAPAIGAQTFTYGVDAGIGETDNVTLVPNDKVSQTIAVADFDLALNEQTRLLDIKALGNFSYLDYLQDAYRGQLIGRFDGQGQVAIIPEHLSWVLQDSFGQAQIDPFTAASPANREDINYVSTGPDLALRIGSLGFFDATARYARTQYEVSPFDSNRFSGSVAFGRRMSANSNLSVDGGYERVEFDNTVVNADFSRSSVYGRYEVQGARTNLNAILGLTRVDQGNDSVTGPDVNLEISRELSAAAKLTLSLRRDQTDGSTSFSGATGFGGPPGGVTPTPGSGGVSALPGGPATGIGATPAAVTSSNYTITDAALGWQYVRNRSTFSLSGRWERDSYSGQPLLNVSRSDAEFRVERRLTRALTAELSGSVLRTQFVFTDYAETDGLVGAGLSFREGKGLEIRLRYSHTTRIASGIGSGTGYDENRVFLTVGYRPRPKDTTS
jgi:hypothetical protein